jgi:hypothetical protein
MTKKVRSLVDQPTLRYGCWCDGSAFAGSVGPGCDARSEERALRLAALGARGGQDRQDLAEDGADTGYDVGHNCTSGHGHETSHQSILNQVLASRFLPSTAQPCKDFHSEMIHLIESARADDAHLRFPRSVIIPFTTSGEEKSSQPRFSGCRVRALGLFQGRSNVGTKAAPIRDFL